LKEGEIMYKAIYLEREMEFVTGNDIDMTFILMDSNNNLVTNLSDFKIKCEAERLGTEIKLANTLGGGNDTQISVSGSKFTIHMSETDTTDISIGKYIIEIEIEKDGKKNTVYRDYIEFKEEIVDW